MTLDAATVPCPACAQPVHRASRGCDACAVRLTPGPDGRLVTVLPPIHPGEVIVGYDLTRQPLPGSSSRDETWSSVDGCSGAPEGVIVWLRGGMVWAAQRYLRVRDVCVRACFDTLDEGLRVRVVARKDAVGAASVWYEMAVTPDDRSARLSRFVSSPDRSDATPLVGPLPHAAVAPRGASNIVELRVQGPTLEGWVNGQRIGAVHDPTLGIGGVALAVGTVHNASETRPQQRALVRWFEVREVMA